MFRFFLYNFFNTYKEPYENMDFKKLTNFISNKNLIEEIILKKRFQSEWRTKLGNTIFKEHYSLKNLQVKKSNTNIMLITRLYRSFSLINSSFKKACMEEVQYIFIIKDMKIIYMCNKEESPLVYNNILKNFPYKDDYLTDLKSNLIREKYTKNIDQLYSEFSKNIPANPRIEYKRTNYNLNKDSIIKYARQYALNYNKSYKNFDTIGGDCTNFVSQCLHSGGLPFSLTWKPYTDTWIRVNELYYYILKMGFDSTESSSYLNPADVIQFHSIKKGFFSHSGIITEVLPNNDCLYCCHSFNKLDYPLSEVYPLLYNKIRVVNIK